MTSVEAGLTYTHNIGNYESIKVHVAVTDDVREGEKVNEAFERVYDYVEKKMLEKTTQIKEELG